MKVLVIFASVLWTAIAVNGSAEMHREARLVVARPGGIPGGRPVVGVGVMRPAVVGTVPVYGGAGGYGGGYGGAYATPGVMGPGYAHAVNPYPAFGGGLAGRPHVHPMPVVGRPVVVG